jgi:hypothetical protein
MFSKPLIYLTLQSYLMKVIPETHRVHLIRYGEVYSIQVYVIKFVSDFRKVSGFLKLLRFPPSIKKQPQYNRNIVEKA